MKKFLLFLFLLLGSKIYAGILFSQSFTHSTYSLNSEKIIATKDGGCLVSGTAYDGLYLSLPFLIKMDALGDTSWARIIFDPVDSLPLRLQSFIELPNGNGFIGCGSSWRKGALCGIDANGSITWMKFFTADTSRYYRFLNLVKTNDDSLIISGYTFTGDTTFIIKTDFQGNSSWMKKFTLHLGDNFDSFMLVDKNGFILNVTGGTFMKMDNYGNILWSYAYQYSSSYVYYYFNGIDTTDDGKFVLSVLFGDNAWFSYQSQYYMKVDSVGNVQWKRSYYDTFAESGEVGNICSLRDGKIVVAANASPFHRLFVCQIDSSGITNEISLDTSQYDFIGMTKNYSGQLYFLTRGWSNLSGSFQNYVSLADSFGNTLCGQNSTPVIQPDTVNNVPKNSVNLSLADFPMQVNNYQNFQALYSDFNLETKCSTVSAEEVALEGKNTLYPNPCNESLTVQSSQSIEGPFEFRILDSFGRVIKSFTGSKLNVELSTTDLSPGLYFLSIHAKFKFIQFKFVKN